MRSSIEHLLNEFQSAPCPLPQEARLLHKTCLLNESLARNSEHITNKRQKIRPRTNKDPARASANMVIQNVYLLWLLCPQIPFGMYYGSGSIFLTTSVLQCEVNCQYLLTLQVSRYCLLALQNIIYTGHHRRYARQANTKRLPCNTGLMSGQRCRRSTNNKPTLSQYFFGDVNAR